MKDLAKVLSTYYSPKGMYYERISLKEAESYILKCQSLLSAGTINKGQAANLNLCYRVVLQHVKKEWGMDRHKVEALIQENTGLKEAVKLTIGAYNELANLSGVEGAVRIPKELLGEEEK